MAGKYPVTVSEDLLIRAGVSITAALRELIACVHRFLHIVAFSIRTPILSNSENTWNYNVELPQPRMWDRTTSRVSRRITLKIIKLIANGAIR